ncbi:hypothetical protein [Gilvimarinus chinensis]|uniref:hypothetical protein n=1 Tax=Gilvimarinus chinensis TaxID=396005 RepID=UPI00036E316C|nr:hypothetical protein [Gilvimarinus chinensis]
MLAIIRNASAITLLMYFTLSSALAVAATEPDFDIESDLLLLQFDSKTDVDDLHTIAAVASVLRLPQFDSIQYHAVAGAYGDQNGLYVPSPELFKAAFADQWSDAHNQYEKTLQHVTSLVSETLNAGGDVWVVEAGQSNFSADWVANVAPEAAKNRVHVIQHSNWNEEQTNPADLAFVKKQTDYQKIPDGNAVGNGTPGFKSNNMPDISRFITSPELRKVWDIAIEKANYYNGLNGRYDNDAISAGGLDFSDTVELCWILGLPKQMDVESFFLMFSDSKSDAQ